MDKRPENTGADVQRGEGGKWLPGASPNPGGKPKKLREIEAVLDEFRTPEEIRENMRVLKKLALQGVTNDVFDKEGAVCGSRTTYHPAYMEMLMNRTLGLVKDPPVDLSDVPDDELRTLREKLRQ